MGYLPTGFSTGATFGGEKGENLQKQTKETKRGFAGAAVTPGLPGTCRAARNRIAISLFTFFTLAGIRRRGCNTQLYIVRMVRNAVLPSGGDFFESFCGGIVWLAVRITEVLGLPANN